MRHPFLYLALFVSGMITAPLQAQPTPERLYVGTYSTRGSEGIYTFAFDRTAGTLTQIGSTKNDKSPSFLALHPSKRYLYSVNESSDGPNGVNAYAIDAKTGALTLLNQGSSEGSGPCHVSLDKTGRLAFISAYGGGTFAALPVGADGRVGAPSFKMKYEGGNPANPRQNGVHIHSATVSPDNRFVYVADLGSDRIYTYAIDATKQRVSPAATPYTTVKGGSGPRHMVIHPNGRFTYLVEELTSSTAAFSRDAKTGALTLLQDNVPTLPADFSAQNTSADIHMDPSGKFVYQSNRGLNALSMLTVGADGKLTMAGTTPTDGKAPRNFWVDPRGQFVIVANQETDNLVVFRRDTKTGKLTPTGHSVKVPAPVCVISGN
ncbi:6-phosphogluconolactonase [Fibrella aestuarina BUZ 2]|uniref:6-phosphogluconolactonase n=1 Tax=Fibrella aestuarina BUZ 2 TaxID=1166018 RepID=I0KGN4_9BACT|nr:lactonase family protein [Fibrella aestuarina]CCH03287.1 6-phosphogluconolactonase [Fibrella aestuarina BUZ 2]